MASNQPSDSKQRSRPPSLAVISLLAILVYGLGYIATLILLTKGSEELSWGRLLAEPPEYQGGIPWPGWDRIGEGVRGESDSLVDELAALYWVAKLKALGGLFIGPILISGWSGVWLGRPWGRALLHTYLALWMTNKVIYLYLYHEEGVFRFSLAAGMTVLLIYLLNLPSWRGWIESGGFAREGATPIPASAATHLSRPSPQWTPERELAVLRGADIRQAVLAAEPQVYVTPTVPAQLPRPNPPATAIHGEEPVERVENVEPNRRVPDADSKAGEATSAAHAAGSRISGDHDGVGRGSNISKEIAVLLVGGTLLAGLALCPPWKRTWGDRSFPLGHGFVWHGPFEAGRADGEVDLARLVLEGGAVVLLTGTALLVARRQGMS